MPPFLSIRIVPHCGGDWSTAARISSYQPDSALIRREHYLSPNPLACYTPAIIDKPLDVNRVEPQGAPATSHLDMRKVGPALAGCVLNHPGNADPQFLGHISCPNQLSYGPIVDCDRSHEIFMVASIQKVHRSTSSPLWACLLFTVLARFCQIFVRGRLDNLVTADRAVQRD